MENLPNSAKFARRALKLLLIPLVLVLGLTRFTPVQWGWLDPIFFASLALLGILVVVSRIFK